MPTIPVKVLTDLITRKQIIKEDSSGNVLFRVTGSINDGYVTSSLPITASYFVGDGSKLTNITASYAEIANLAYTASSLTIALKNALEDTYKKLRYKVTGTFDASGYAYEIIPNNLSYTFPVADLDYININILTRENSTSSWTNDIIAYEMKISGALNDEIHVLMYAQDIASLGQYKLLAINENGDAFNI